MVFHIRCLSFFEADVEESPKFYTPPSSLETSPAKGLRVFTFSELEEATNNFSQSSKICEGGSGCVYKGVIKSHVDSTKTYDVAVKRLGKTILKGHKEWEKEVKALGAVVHDNVVTLVGYCAKDKERLLVYECMPNRSVEDHLSTRSKAPLSWTTRLKVAQDVARGLAYLHEKMRIQLVFKDLRSSNILLDDQCNAELFDFVSAQLVSEGLTHVSTSVVGAIGCMAPEHIETGRLTAKTDVWSYGAFLYELITGRLPLDTTRPENEQKLLEWVKPYIDSERLELIIDPRLEGNYSLESVQKLSIIANKCLYTDPRSRPRMSKVLQMVTQTGVPLRAPPRNGLVSAAFIEPKMVLQMVNQPITVVPPQTPPRNDLVSVATIEPKMVLTHAEKTTENIKNEGQTGSQVLQMVNQPITVVPPQTPPRNDPVSVGAIEPKMVLTPAKKTTENMKNEGETGSTEIQRKESACFSLICCRGQHQI